MGTCLTSLSGIQSEYSNPHQFDGTIQDIAVRFFVPYFVTENKYLSDRATGLFEIELFLHLTLNK